MYSEKDTFGFEIKIKNECCVCSKQPRTANASFLKTR